MNDVWTALDELCIRLPRLLSDRASWSHDPSKSYPTTLRLTTRMMDPSISKKRRPYVTRSKQTAINGIAMVTRVAGAFEDETKRATILKGWVIPLVRQLIPPSMDINLTRLNLAVTNFPDTVTSGHQKQLHSPGSKVEYFSTPSEKEATKRPLDPSEGKSVVVNNPRRLQVQTLLPPTKRRKPGGTHSGISRHRSQAKTARIDHFFSRKAPGT
jgi:hypothetical protein